VVWQLHGDGKERETRAIRLIGVTFFALAAYLAAENIHDLVSGGRQGQSVAGLAVTAAALLVMPGLAIAKRRTGQTLGSRTLVGDYAETACCAFTSAAALTGLGLNAWLGWWWADPAAALAIAALPARGGIEAWAHDYRRRPDLRDARPEPAAESSAPEARSASAPGKRSAGRTGKRDQPSKLPRACRGRCRRQGTSNFQNTPQGLLGFSSLWRIIPDSYS
jgi:hypothetical protein